MFNVDEMRAEYAAIDRQIQALQDRRRDLRKECSHKYPDGSDATEGVPVSGERFCRTCGTQYD